MRSYSVHTLGTRAHIVQMDPMRRMKRSPLLPALTPDAAQVIVRWLNEREARYPVPVGLERLTHDYQERIIRKLAARAKRTKGKH